jgi:hypothetical protein
MKFVVLSIKLILQLFLTKEHAMKTYDGAEV